jgi:hypothetical protein
MEKDYSEFRPSRIWKSLSADRRAVAARLFWADEQSTDQQLEAVGAIAGHMKFRPKTVIGLPPDKKIRYLATLPNVSDSIAARALVAYHLETQRPMMSAFLDSLSIGHEDGLISEENVTRPDAARLRSAAADLSTKFPADDVALYFSTLVSQDPETWGELSDLTETRALKIS